MWKEGMQYADGKRELNPIFILRVNIQLFSGSKSIKVSTGKKLPCGKKYRFNLLLV